MHIQPGKQSETIYYHKFKALNAQIRHGTRFQIQLNGFWSEQGITIKGRNEVFLPTECTKCSSILTLNFFSIWRLMMKYTMHTLNIIEDCGNHKKLTLQCIRIRSCQDKKVLEEWRASISNNYHVSWWSVEFSRGKIFVWYDKDRENSKNVKECRRWTYDNTIPWSPINRGVPLPLAIPWHKRSQVGDDKVVM